ncbi:MAG: hypothetical protein LZF60_20048 [Nitrospira sp.]|nr:MAG: hypothetical protein LZF60_20048 [Nitrospira sp.]
MMGNSRADKAYNSCRFMIRTSPTPSSTPLTARFQSSGALRVQARLAKRRSLAIVRDEAAHCQAGQCAVALG